ncbi:hypothetical protein KCM76_25305 [Zooshikella marina]|uniref:hypothetical protein n=1 Tax=Zooshikella ganghwensis TaxID=202772 RepID=UPI001BAF2135|nr:hypothetical protein [Zooshikella ganghwensis]MBU2709338.1 hypothetical protein [Zooshikella ganghwensis]
MTIRLYFVFIMLILPFIAEAKVQISKDWYWDLSLNKDEFVYAATENSEGRVLGQYCYIFEKSCVYIVSLGISCKEGSKFPSIVNSSAGAVGVNLICGHKYNKENVFYITPFDDIDNLIKKASKVGFVVAMKDNKFKVVRFSLSGSTYAIEMMRAGAELLNESKEKKSSKVKSEEYL